MWLGLLTFYLRSSKGSQNIVLGSSLELEPGHNMSFGKLSNKILLYQKYLIYLMVGRNSM